jgi:hypothetical protein
MAVTVIGAAGSLLTLLSRLLLWPMHVVAKVWSGYWMTPMSAVTVKSVAFLLG